MKKLLVFSFLFFTTLIMSAQQKYIVKGIVADSKTKEALIGAKINIKEAEKFTSTRLNGDFSVTLPAGTYTIIVTYLGYQKLEKSVTVNANITVDFDMIPDVTETKTVVVNIENKAEENVESTDVGKIEVDIEQVKLLPAALGEVDVMKTLQLLPGVQSAGEGQSGLYIRGGGPDQNLVLFDDAPILNTGHLFGFFSVFNADAVDDVQLYKGGIPAQYGGRLSSVVDFGMREGDMDKWHADGGIGIIASRLTVNGPIKKGKTSILLSGRRTYIDVVSKPFLKNTESGGIPYFFYDANGKITHIINDKNKLTLSGYTGRDVVNLNLLDGRFKANFDWGNATSTFKWDHTFNEKWKSEFALIYNNYSFDATAEFDQFKNVFESRIRDYTGKYTLDFYPNDKSSVKMGVQHTYHTFIPRTSEVSNEGVNFTSGILNPDKRGHESGVFVSYDYDVTKKFRFNVGARQSFFTQVGPYNVVVENGDTNRYKSNEKVVTYTGFEPRVALRYKIDSTSSVKASITKSNQYMHLTSLSGNALPFDIWVPSSDKLLPQTGTQYAAGYYKNFKDDKFTSSAEIYYKSMRNLIEYREDYVATATGELEDDLVFGDGYSYGLELFISKTQGNFQGWLGYTWSKTYRKFPDINGGEEFPYRYDRRHDLSLVGTYKLNDRWTFGATFVYGTGQAITIQQARYVINNSVINEYGPRNGFRLPAYHRFDLSATLKNKPEKKFESSWTFALYNAYNRANPYIVYVDTEGDVSSGQLDVQAKLLYIFPILPSATWNFKF